MKTEITAKFGVKDEEGNAMVDGEGKALYEKATCLYDLGENLDEAIELFGAEVVFSNYFANGKIAVQNIIRERLKSGQTQEQIQEFLDTFKLGMVAEKAPVDPLAATKNIFAKMSDEQKQAFLAQLGVEV